VTGTLRGCVTRSDLGPGETATAPHVVHSADFVAAWREVVTRALRWRIEGECVRVPGLSGGTTLSYLPLLNYTDLAPAGARELARGCGERAYLVRALDWDAEAAPGEPVTLRLDLAGGDRDLVWQHRLDGKCRNQVRKAQRSGLELRCGSDDDLIGDFHALFARTLHRHGAPLLPRALFALLAQRLGARFYVAYRAARAVAALVALVDRDLVWVPWAASDPAALSTCPNHLTYWSVIEHAVGDGKQIFDFGRSPFGGATHRFKRQWGAREVTILQLSSQPANVYDRYASAQRWWRRLPGPVVDRLGPLLCHFLADY
jgi:hypothetical protein